MTSLLERARATSELALVKRDAFGDGGNVENPRVPLSSIFNVAENASGIVVTERTALQLTAVQRCVSLISTAIAKVPTLTYRRTENGRERDPNHYLWQLFRRSANPFMNAFRFKKIMQTWLLLWGNAYAEILENGKGQVVGLLPMRPDRMMVGGTIANPRYVYTLENGEQVEVPAHYMFHLRGLELDGLVGISPIRMARNTIGVGMAAEQYGARFFQNNGRPGGLLIHPNTLGAPGRKNLRESWSDIHQGIKGSHRIGILEEGMKYQEVGLPPEDMQFLETRQFQGIDIARLYGVPPHKIAELQRATFSNIEHQGIEFVTDCLGDWFANWEAEISHQLLSERDARVVYVEFLADALMRGDMKSRFDAYKVGIDGSFLCPNEVRDRENLNRYDGGDEFRAPLNTAAAGEGDEEDESVEDNPDGEEDDDLASDPGAQKAAKKAAQKAATKKAAKKQLAAAEE